MRYYPLLINRFRVGVSKNPLYFLFFWVVEVGFFSDCRNAAAEEIIVEPELVYYRYSWGPDGPVKSLEEFRSYVNPGKEQEYSQCVAAEPKRICAKQTLSNSWRLGSGPKTNGYTQFIQFGFGQIQVSYYGESRTEEFQGIPVQVAFKCPNGSVSFSTGPANDNTLKCIYQRSYSAVKLQEIEPLSCSSQPQAVGNPIMLSSGAKLQSEQIQFEGFEVFYQFNLAASKQDPWQQKPDVLKRGNNLQIEDKSKFYPTKPEACINGLLEFRSRSPSNSWIQNVTAEYDGCQCLLRKGGQIVSVLGLQSDADFAGSPSSLDLLQYKHTSGAITNYYRDCSTNQYKSFGSNRYGLFQELESGELQLSSANGIKVFDAKGYVTATYTRGGQLLNQYEYDAQGNLSSVSNEHGRFDYIFLGGRLNSIRSPSGKLMQFNYSGNLLTRVTHPDQTTRLYHYEDPRFPNNLTGITDERGVRFATWKYDDKGRAISSEHAGGAEKTSLAFNADGSTTVTNALGKKTTYSFTDILGARRVTNVTGEPTATCVGANQAYTYTPQGLVETKTDWNGSVTKYTYDNLGREISRTQAYGTPDAKTVQTCWHETLNQPSRVIEPTKITQFDYTATGQLKSQVVKPRSLGAVDCATSI